MILILPIYSLISIFCELRVVVLLNLLVNQPNYISLSDNMSISYQR